MGRMGRMFGADNFDKSVAIVREVMSSSAWSAGGQRLSNSCARCRERRESAFLSMFTSQ